VAFFLSFGVDQFCDSFFQMAFFSSSSLSRLYHQHDLVLYSPQKIEIIACPDLVVPHLVRKDSAFSLKAPFFSFYFEKSLNIDKKSCYICSNSQKDIT